MFASPLSVCPIWRGLEGVLCRDISLSMRRLDFGCSYCPLPLLAGAGGAVRGGEVGESGELDWRCAVRVSFGAKGLGNFLGHVCCLWGMLSITAPCWSCWGGELGESGELDWRCAVRVSFGAKGLGKFLGHVCCLWGMLSITAPCWS